ncbi:amylo-alpha-1,6-glucosidase [Micromonospora auratinigra]|uniref:Glycogen debranching enzyme (Alpha-1,6-glucosidase) n=1 Tax=Micromonospora auratinigra TaxID=261654 RepID=A0A1A8Z466_9ACTN|nr:glycogen debranching N-terminal domain-containing protein [Micromonospora auratinigra]SBT38724.1 Glycogen debranching enzyme (alpha-1,6-glucosidase) [Micromonospora auratinigra]
MELISILDGNTFLVSTRDGDIDPSPDYPSGLFSNDTRFLSTWQLTLNGERLHALSVDEQEYFMARFFVVPGRPTQYIDAKLSAIRRRTIGGSFTEDLAILNHTQDEVRLTVRMEMDSDFADIFDVKDPQQPRGAKAATVVDGALRLSYQRDTFHRETVITSSEPAAVDDHGMTFDITVPPHGEWNTQFHVQLVLGPRKPEYQKRVQAPRARPVDRLRGELREWVDNAPRLGDGSPAGLVDAYQRSLVDLAALRYTSITMVADLIAAGLPWFVALFGRDSIFTCLQVMPVAPQLSAPTIGILARTQGSRLNDFRDEEPGKILHEARTGESAAFEEQPHSPYYGSADSTPLFVVLLDEYERWTGDAETVRAFEFEARAALDWIDTYADLLGNGYIWYQTRNPEKGLVNQCWKDSWDAISYADGRLAGYPLATCELQGYAYDAKMRGARLARTFWNDPAYAARLEQEAAELRDRFNRDFWVADGGYYALALDADGGQVDALSSNIGHLLWSGIVPPSRARRVADLLMSPRLFSGWGVRTLATDAGRFNPLGYHVGTVWPFDNSIIAWGLRRYGFAREAATICKSMIEAAGFFDGRLPEAFAGHDRSRTTYPVEYPTACSPQAWSSGAIVLFLRVLLGLDPDGENLIIRPHIPDGMGRIELLNIPGRWGRLDALGRSRRG